MTPQPHSQACARAWGPAAASPCPPSRCTGSPRPALKPSGKGGLSPAVRVLRVRGVTLCLPWVTRPLLNREQVTLSGQETEGGVPTGVAERQTVCRPPAHHGTHRPAYGAGAPVTPAGTLPQAPAARGRGRAPNEASQRNKNVHGFCARADPLPAARQQEGAVLEVRLPLRAAGLDAQGPDAVWPPGDTPGASAA